MKLWPSILPFAHAKKILLLWRKWAIPGLCLIYFRVFKQTLPNSYSIILLHKGKHQCILFYWFGFSCFDILTVSTDIALFVEYKPAKQEVSHIAYFSHIVILLADVSWVKWVNWEEQKSWSYVCQILTFWERIMALEPWRPVRAQVWFYIIFHIKV